MAISPKELERLAEELRALSAEDRAKVLGIIAANEKPAGPPKGWRPPLIRGGTWTGGSLRREDMYGDDGR